MPSTLAVYIGTWKITLARIAILILLPTSIAILSRSDRRSVLSDFLVCATAIWMIWATSGPGGLSPTGSFEAVEFLGFYFIARAYLFGPAAITAYALVLRTALVVIVLLAIADPLSGHYLINDVIGGIFKTPTLLSGREIEHYQRQVFGTTLLRATSTFDYPILFGSFCCISATILLYSEVSSGPKIAFLWDMPRWMSDLVIVSPSARIYDSAWSVFI